MSPAFWLSMIFQRNSIPELTSQIESFFSYFFDKEQLFVGIGPVCHGIQNLKHAMNRAKIAMNMALTMKKPIVNFNEMGVYAVLFSSNDLEILTNYANTLLKPLDDYDRLHHFMENLPWAMWKRCEAISNMTEA